MSRDLGGSASYDRFMPLWSKRLLLAVLAPLLVVGLVEAVLRWTGSGYPTSFLVPHPREGRPVYVDNAFFGYRFFPPRMTRLSAPIVLEKVKKPGVLRVVVLGESAAMGEPQPEFGLARFLEILLADRPAGQAVEVVNAAMTAINSPVLVEIAHELADFRPDVVVLYLGNNEVVGPYGPGTVLAPGGPLTRARVLASRLRLASLLRAVAPGPGWSGMEMFMERPVRAGDPRLDAVYARFQENVRRIIRKARAAGAEVVLSTVAVNLRDCAPFAGAEARQAYAQGRWSEARDLDTLRFRADSTLNGILRKLAADSGPGVRLVDAESLFGEAGRADFVDHVHFTAAGNYRLAVAVAEAIRPAGPARPTLAECLERMGYTPWSEWDLVDGLIGRRQRPPFAGQLGNEEQLAELLARRAELQATLAQDPGDRTGRQLEALLDRNPGDVRLQMQWSSLLMNSGRYGEAEAVQRRAVARMPHRFDLRAGLALLLGYQGRAQEGVQVVRETPGRPGHFVAEFLLATARTLAREQHLPAALVFAEAALSESPRNDDARVEVAIRNAALGRKTVAEEYFRKVLQRNPSHRQARDEFAAFLALQRRWDEALAVLLGAGLDPATRLKQAQLLMARGDWTGADRVLRELEGAGDLADEVAALRARWSHLARP